MDIRLGMNVSHNLHKVYELLQCLGLGVDGDIYLYESIRESLDVYTYVPYFLIIVFIKVFNSIYFLFLVDTECCQHILQFVNESPAVHTMP